MKKRLLAAAVILCTCFLSAHAQTHLMPTGGNTIINGTGFTLMDPGGNTNVPANCSGSVTIYPSAAGQKVRLTFTTLNLGGAITVYNGTQLNQNQIAPIYSSNESIYTDIISTDVMGCLTIYFSSSNYQAGHGFAATVDEVSPYPAPGIRTSLSVTTLPPFLTSQQLSYSLQIYDKPNDGPLFYPDIQMVLSPDSFLTAGDTVLSNLTYAFFAEPGQGYTETGTVQIPHNLAPGQYYLLAVANYTPTCNQPAGSPVTVSVAVNIGFGSQEVAASNLNVNPSFNDTVVTGFSFYGTVDVVDSGNLPISNTEVCIYLSPDSVLDSHAIALDTFNTYTLPPFQQQVSYYNTHIVPATVAPGNYYLTAKADFQGLINAPYQQNNITTTRVTVVAPYIDMGVKLTNILPDTLYGGVENNIDLTLLDLSRYPAAKSEMVDIYISSDSTLDSTDIMVYSQMETGLNGNLVLNPTVLLPDYLTGGNFYLIAKINTQYNYNDINLSNNISIQPVFVVPLDLDLQVISAAAPDSLTTAPNTSVSFEVSGVLRDNGLTSVINTSVDVYFSKDTILSNDDTYLSNVYITSVHHQSGVPFSSYYIQVSADTSRHYLLFVCNPGNLLTEYNYNNNVLAKPFHIDITPYDVALTGVLPDTLHAYVLEPINVKASCINHGPTQASSTINAYLSTDTTLAGVFAYGLTSQYYSYTFPSNAVDSNWVDLRIPDVAPGHYYLILFADSANTLYEHNLANNKTWAHIIIDSAKYDLFPRGTSVFNNGNLAAGTTASFSGYVEDTSITNSYVNVNTKVSVYASMDTVLNIGDIFIGSTTVQPFYAFSNQYFNINAVVPNAAIGYKYILFLCDSGNVINETNYANNVAYDSVTIGPVVVNLYPADAGTSLTGDSVYVGTGFNVTCRMYETGNTPSTPCSFNVYLGTDSFYQAGDILLASNYMAAVQPGSYGSINNYIYASSIPGPGTYYLLFYADYGHTEPETTYADNVTYVPITVKPDLYDIQLTTFTAAAIQYPVNTSLSDYVKIYNRYTSLVDSFYINLYLSADTLYHPGDVLIGSYRYLSPVYGNSYSAININGVIPTGTVPGNYYLVAYADATQTYAETTFQNNFGWAPVQVVDSSFDLYPANYVDTALTFYVGNYTPTPAFEVCNFGLSPSIACNIALYLSDTTFVDGNSIELRTQQLAGIPAMQYVNCSFGSFYFPNVAGGHYYLIAAVDSAYESIETNPDNNLAIWPVTVPGPYVDIEMERGALPDTLYTNGLADPGIVGFVMRNIGTRASPENGFTCQYLLSHNPVPDSTARVLTTVTGYFIQAKDSQIFYPGGLLPSNITPGNYYIIAFGDVNYSGPDVDPSNNYLAFPVVIEPGYVDFIIDSAAVADTLALNISNQPYSIRVRNTGPLDGYSIYGYDIGVNVYLSKDSVYSGNAGYLGYTYFTNINARSSVILNGNLPVLNTDSAGWYYLIFYVNPANQVTELNDSNNTFSVRVYLGTGGTDLGVSAFTVSVQTAVAGTGEYLSAYIENYTPGSVAKPCYGKLYLGKDSLVDAGAILLDSFLVSGLSYDYPGRNSSAIQSPTCRLGVIILSAPLMRWT